MGNTRKDDYVEEWACGCMAHYIEVDGKYRLMDSEYCGFGQRLFERHVREVYRPTIVNPRRQRHTFKKLLQIHRAKHDLRVRP